LVDVHLKILYSLKRVLLFYKKSRGCFYNKIDKIRFSRFFPCPKFENKILFAQNIDNLQALAMKNGCLFLLRKLQHFLLVVNFTKRNFDHWSKRHSREHRVRDHNENDTTVRIGNLPNTIFSRRERNLVFLQSALILDAFRPFFNWMDAVPKAPFTFGST